MPYYTDISSILTCMISFTYILFTSSTPTLPHIFVLFSPPLILFSLLLLLLLFSFFCLVLLYSYYSYSYFFYNI
ncbi:hypothetical protein CLU79DRAFT_382759 [Phycomyces nitens]|nr:hypothetical protein CLU79DRAFT_382759 [Phycomyces nitens]